jgi:hypothetical protein
VASVKRSWRACNRAREAEAGGAMVRLPCERKACGMSYYELTKFDVAALAQCDTLSVHLSNSGGAEAPRVWATKRIEKTERNPFAQDADHHMAVPVRINTGLGYGHALDTAEARCWAYLTNYKSTECHVASVLRTLRAGDAIAFEFYPDSGSTRALAQSGFHGDSLRLIVERKGRKDGATRDLFEMCRSVAPDNSARMCKGIPSPAWYLDDANSASV